MSRNNSKRLVKGTLTHRRTESDYIDILLETVTLDDWREVVKNALDAAKLGDTSARKWLAQYLAGNPANKAPTPLTVVVQRWSGEDPVAKGLAEPIIEREMFPAVLVDEEWEQDIRSTIEAELAEKLTGPEGNSGNKSK